MRLLTLLSLLILSCQSYKSVHKKAIVVDAAHLEPPLSLLIDHIDHIVRLVGVDHVGLGADFDGISSAPKELKDVAAMPLVTIALCKEDTVRKQ